MHRCYPQQPLFLSFGVVFLIHWASFDIVYNGFGGDWNPGGSRVGISGSVPTFGIRVEVLLQMSRPYEPLDQIMEAPAYLHCVTMLLMIGAFFTMIPFGWVRSEGSGPPEVKYVLDHREKFLIGYGKGREGRPFRATWPFLPSIERPWPVRKFGTASRATSGCLPRNQDLLGGCSHVIFEH